MEKSLFFYDLETSGFNPKEDRAMQFAGQRTDMALNPLGEPYNFYIKLTEDVLPNPSAVLLTGITPQKTLAEGIAEPEFLQIFHSEIATPGTIFVGFNTIRFDDEFMRYMHYRNFYDPYEWHWRDGRGRWDILDVARMTRALRPAGINWPLDEAGKSSNRLGLLTDINQLKHAAAHDALSDVRATIAVANMIRSKQPKLFAFLLSMRDKNKVAALVRNDQPFIYTSGQYASEWEKTTAVGLLAEYPDQSAALVFDLRHDPVSFADLKPAELAAALQTRQTDQEPKVPIKTLKFNSCPAVAPLSVLDTDSQARLRLDLVAIDRNFQKLRQSELARSALGAVALLAQRHKIRPVESPEDADNRLYDGFFADEDRAKMKLVRMAGAAVLSELDVSFRDSRLRFLLPLYKARHFPETLSAAEREDWEQFKAGKLLAGGDQSRLARYQACLKELALQSDLSNEQRGWLKELILYGQDVGRAGKI